MIYLFIGNNQLKALYFKKSLFGQFDIRFFEKKFQLNLTENNKIVNTDVLASAIKEVTTNLLPPNIKEKEVVLILTQPNFLFLRTTIPDDITQTTIYSFIQDKVRSSLNVELDDYCYDYSLSQQDQVKQVNIYLIHQDTINQYGETLKLLEMKISNIIPETLAYFKLFDKTLHKEKKENILFAHYEKNEFYGYIYDSLGLLENQPINISFKQIAELEKQLKQKATEYETKNQKINRLILSGEESESIRQDTFTKNSGIWTNPLKKITTNFYQDQLKLLTPPSPTQLQFPLLTYDVCFGSFIFLLDNKKFSLGKKTRSANKPKPSLPEIKINREVIIFLLSFLASSLLFLLLMKLNIKFNLPTITLPKINKKITPTAKPTPLPPTPTPTISFKPTELKLKILNGGGVTGKATVVKNIFKKAGYQDIVTDNADNFDYEKTVIQIKKSKKAAFDVLAKEIKDYTSSVKEENLAEDETADVIIIIGQDFK